MIATFSVEYSMNASKGVLRSTLDEYDEQIAKTGVGGGDRAIECWQAGSIIA